MGLLCCSGVFLDKATPADLSNNCPGEYTKTQLQHSTRMTQHTPLDNPTPTALFKKCPGESTSTTLLHSTLTRQHTALDNPTPAALLRNVLAIEQAQHYYTSHTHTTPTQKHTPPHIHTQSQPHTSTQSQTQTDNVTGKPRQKAPKKLPTKPPDCKNEMA